MEASNLLLHSLSGKRTPIKFLPYVYSLDGVEYFRIL